MICWAWPISQKNCILTGNVDDPFTKYDSLQIFFCSSANPILVEFRYYVRYIAATSIERFMPSDFQSVLFQCFCNFLDPFLEWRNLVQLGLINRSSLCRYLWNASEQNLHGIRTRPSRSIAGIDAATVIFPFVLGRYIEWFNCLLNSRNCFICSCWMLKWSLFHIIGIFCLW